MPGGNCGDIFFFQGNWRSKIGSIMVGMILFSTQQAVAVQPLTPSSCSGAECITQFIERHIRPSMQAAYKAYYDKWGSRVSDIVWDIIETRRSQKSVDSEVRARYPAFAKIAYEKSVYEIFNALGNIPIESINESLQSGFDILGNAYEIISNPEVHSPALLRVQRAVNEMRPHMLDSDMRACLRGHIIDVPISNAFNTGCHIFITSSTVDMLSDGELLAVIAHEMGHSARGDSLDNFVALLIESSKQSGLLLLDEAQWFLTGQDYEHLKALQNGEFLDLILRGFGRQAERVELMADLMSAKALANHSPEFLVTALIKLVAGESGVDDVNRVRQYPNLQKRIDTIGAYAASL